MKEHHVKLKHRFFEEVLNGEKTFEVRLNDRGYKRGDIIILNEVIVKKEFNNTRIKKEETLVETGRKIEARIGYVLKLDLSMNLLSGIPKFDQYGYVTFSLIQPTFEGKEIKPMEDF